MNEPLSPESNQQACCACLHVVYARQIHAGGLCSDRWECRDCGTEFGRIAWLVAENAKLREREAKLRRDVDTLREVASCAADFIAVSAKDQRDDEEEGDAYMHLYFAVQNLSAAKEKP